MRRSRLLWHRLLRLAIAATVPLAVVAGMAVATLLSQQTREGEQTTLDFTRAFANAVQADLERSVAALAVMAASPLVDRGDMPAYRELLTRALQTLPDWHAIELADPSGRVIAHTGHADAAQAPVIDEPASFRRALAERRAVVGQLARHAGSGLWGVPVRWPVVRRDRVVYVLSAMLKPETILKIVQRQRLPADWVVSVFDAREMRIARSRGHEISIGTGPSPSLHELIARGAAEGSGVTLALEGDRIYTAYVRLPDSGWIVATGVPTAAHEAELQRAVGIYGGGIVLSLALAAWLALLFARRINRPIAELRDAARALGRGETPPMPSTTIAEVNEVADTLAEAARLRARHEAERDELLLAERHARTRLEALAAENASLYEHAEAARAQAESANRAKDEFLAMLGHELRNPLAPIVTALELMKLRHASVAERERAIIERQVRHLSRLVDDLLDVSRVAQGKVQLDRKRIDLRQVVEKAVENSEPAFADRLPLQVALPTEPVWMDGDEVRLTQIVGNLINNAVKFTPPQGAIRLALAVNHDEAIVVVSDDGMGIAPALLPRVFELFVQGEQALDRRGGGLGLGLGIVKMLVEQHGGTVTAESAGIGHGSRFTVRLPRAHKPPVPHEAPPPRTSARHAGRVMLVDDNVDAAQALGEALREAGYEVSAVHDGPSALAALDAFRPHVAVLDIGLPGMTGYELAAALRADPRLNGLVLIALTGYGRDPDRARAIAAEFDEHLVKPVSFEALLEAIARRVKPS